MDECHRIDDETLTHPLTPAFRAAGARFDSAWFGLFALVSALLYLLAAIVQMISSADHGFWFHVAAFGGNFNQAAWVLAIAALLVPNASSRRLGASALGVWFMALVAITIYAQWHIGGIPLSGF